MLHRTYRWMVVGLVLASLQLSACTPAPVTEEKVLPVHVEPIEGTDLKRLVLTQKAAERLDIQTALVREEVVARTRIVGGEVVAQPGTEAASPGAVWVRVSLNESDLNKVARGKPALIRSLDDDGEDEDGLEAEADEGPADDDLEDNDTGEGTLYYTVANVEQSLALGQRVFVEVALSGNGTPGKVIPYAAVIYDLHGETWVYTSPEPLVFVRHPIVVEYIEDDRAVLSEGPAAGTAVVIVGAAELFGVESGVGGGH